MTPDMQQILKYGFTAFKQRTGLNNNDIAEKLGCSPSSVSLYCSGKTNLTYDTVYAFLEMGVRIRELFGDKIAAIVAKEYGIEAADSEKIVFDGLWRILQKYVSDKPNENLTETK